MAKGESMEIGFIGLGRMGTGMAASLQRAGNTLTVYNRTPGKNEDLVRAGAKRASRIAEACSGDAIITMLADDSALESVVYGEDGLLASLSEATLHISSSTISTELSERLARDHARRSAFCIRDRIWTAGRCRCRPIVDRHGGRSGCDRKGNAPTRGIGPKSIRRI